MARPIERLLNLQPGDTGRGLLLFTYLFLTMAAYMAARIARDAIFLDTFLPVDLAYVDLASALLIGVFIAAYLSIGRHVNLPRLLAGSLLFYAVNVVGFWYISETHEPDWLPPVMYVWVSLFGALAPAQVWTLANYVLTTREAKRVFGLIGSGAILGAVVGAKLSSLLATRFGAESLLLFVAATMVVCAGLVPAIWQRREAALGADLHARREAEDPRAGASSRRSASSRERLTCARLPCSSLSPTSRQASPAGSSRHWRRSSYPERLSFRRRMRWRRSSAISTSTLDSPAS